MPRRGRQQATYSWCDSYARTEGRAATELAKAYGTTTEQIVQANGLEEGQLPLGQMLLIPSVR